MDEDGSGEITVSDLRRKYNVKMHADFVSGAKSEEELLAEYLMKFEGGEGRKDGRVTLLEFEAYYDKVSFLPPPPPPTSALLTLDRRVAS
jgi:hypothetical protein